VSRPAIEVADIFRRLGPAWRHANAGHVSLGQLKVMSAIETCRTAALGGHVERCEDCAHTQIAYNSCRDRHCPKCQAVAAKEWLAAREAELLPVPYFHIVFTLPAPIADIAYQNKRVLYDILFKAAAETLITIAADPKHLGARIGLTAVLHTWGSALTHHPHVHVIVPGGGIANSRLIAFNDEGVTFKWKDYRANERDRAKVMTLAGDEFIRRFLIHVLPDGFHRIRHYGLFANGGRAENIARVRQLLNVPAPKQPIDDADGAQDGDTRQLSHSCPCCGGHMITIERFERGCAPRHQPAPPAGIDSS
jgi:Transposase zinc-binding domain/Putative transposase